MTFQRPVFGRKQGGFGRRVVPPAAPQPAARETSAERILPDEIWDGPAGDSLRAMGMHPDSPANRRVTQADADALQNDAIEHQRQFLDRVNAQMLSGTRVVAYAMLPWELWNGRFGHMLAITCGMWPQQPWNTMLLAADQRSSMILDLPEHPGGYPDGLIPQVERLLGELRGGMDGAMAEAKAAPELTFDAVDAWDEARTAMIPDIIALAHHVGRICIGEEGYARHRALFGKTLGWPAAG